MTQQFYYIYLHFFLEIMHTLYRAVPLVQLILGQGGLGDL